MKKWLILGLMFGLAATLASAQSKRDDIPVAQLPQEVRSVLDQYVAALNAPTLDSCAALFFPIAGGGLVNPEGTSLDSDLKQFSLKKDYQNIKFYLQPVKIIRVNVRWCHGDGYGASAVKGKVYKIWIAKKPGVAGLTAPVSIMVPEGHPAIKTPKVIGIGSL